MGLFARVLLNAVVLNIDSREINKQSLFIKLFYVL